MSKAYELQLRVNGWTKYEVGDFTSWNEFDGEVIAVDDDIATCVFYDTDQPNGEFTENLPIWYN